jgi:hypothetical protein
MTKSFCIVNSTSETIYGRIRISNDGAIARRPFRSDEGVSTSRSPHPKNTNARSLHRGRWFTSLLALSVLQQRRLRRRQPCDWHAER